MAVPATVVELSAILHFKYMQIKQVFSHEAKNKKYLPPNKTYKFFRGPHRNVDNYIFKITAHM